MIHRVDGNLVDDRGKAATPDWGDLFINEQGKEEKYFPTHKFQDKALTSEARFTAMIAGTGSGKTALAPLWLMREIVKKPKGRFIAISPTFSMLRNAFLTELEKAFSHTPFKGRYVSNRSVYELPTGGLIYLYSADDPDSIQGVHADGAVIDEGGLMPEKVWHNVRQRTNRRRSPVLITSTPYSFNWLYYSVFQLWKDGDKDFNVINCPSWANPTYDKGEFKKEKKRLPEWRFKMLYEGEFTRPAGVIYPGMRDAIIEAGDLPSDRPAQFIGGVDWGYNDPMAALAGYVVDNVLYLVYERYQRFKTVPEFAVGLPKDPIWFCDSSRPDSRKELRKAGFKAVACKKYAGSVADNIDNVTGLIRTGRLKIVRGAVSALLEESDLYTYQPGEREGEYQDKPVDANNHALDALAYLVQGAKRMRLIHD